MEQDIPLFDCLVEIEEELAAEEFLDHRDGEENISCLSPIPDWLTLVGPANLTGTAPSDTTTDSVRFKVVAGTQTETLAVHISIVEGSEILPTKYSLKIRNTETTTAIVYDVLGRIVKTVTSDCANRFESSYVNQSLLHSNLRNGVYFAHTYTRNGKPRVIRTVVLR